MKLVPLLAITNALALGLVVVLYLQYQDLEAQVGSTRAARASHDDVGTAADLDERLAALEQKMLSVRGLDDGAPAIAGEVGEAGARMRGTDLAAPAADGSPAGPPVPTTAEGGEPAGAEYDPVEMEAFRKKVRVAQDLNRDEDWKVRVGGRLDDLVSNNRISPLNDKQKAKVASVLLRYTREAPNVFRRLRESGALDNASREERREIFRAEFDTLRAEAQKSLESTVPAADAKTIMETVGGDRGFMRGGPGGSGRGR